MKVKALKWTSIEKGYWRADALGGHYEIRTTPKGSLLSWIFFSHGRRIADRIGISFKEAKSIAQSDFETIIKAALE